MESQPTGSALPQDAGATGAPSSPTAEDAPQQPASPQPQFTSADMDAWIRGRRFNWDEGVPMEAVSSEARASMGSQGPTLNPDGVVPTADLQRAQAGEPAPPEGGDVNPADVPPATPASPAPGRRSARHAEALNTIEGLRAHIADLEASIPERVAESAREAERARAALADLQRQQ